MSADPRPAGPGPDGPGGPGESGPHPVAEVVLSAERVELGTRRGARERVRVRREVVSEEVSVTVTVRREVLRVEHEPLTGDDPDGDRPGSTGERLPLELVLSEERPVVSLEVVPYERVRVGVREVATDTWVDTSRSREVLDAPVVHTAAGDAAAG